MGVEVLGFVVLGVDQEYADADGSGRLATLDVDTMWKQETEVERRVLIDEFSAEILVLPDYLDATVHGASSLRVRYQAVGLKESDFSGVGGGVVSEGVCCPTA